MILLIVAALFAIAGAFTSVWRIDLSAPQYPEGMVLYIGGTEGVSGGDEGNDLYKINELNHYVGMAQIHPATSGSSQHCQLSFVLSVSSLSLQL